MHENSTHSDAGATDDLPRWLTFRGRARTPWASEEELRAAVTGRPFADQVFAVIDGLSSGEEQE